MLESKLGSIGKPIPNVELKIVDQEGMELPFGETGEIIARGSNIMQGYWKDPKMTATVIKNGYYHTGDLGKTDEDGFFYIVGRSRDIIKVKGFRVSAKEIEETIQELKFVIETAVIGVADPIFGEAIKAYVVTDKRENNDEQKIINFCKKKLAVHKIPKYVEFRSNLPKNESGKIMKNQLKKEP